MAENNQGQKIAESFTISGTKQVVRAGEIVPIRSNQMQALLTSKEEARGKAAAVATSSQWSRIKWTHDMVKLLVSAVSYLEADMESVRRGRRVGKWRVISSVMAERGFLVSPQQCEDKFYDLNKRYKRVTEILGKGTACHIVEHPELLEHVSLPEKLKEEARKHLSSKNLHYEEMCSYNNWNRYSLLTDPDLQMALRRLAAWGPEDLLRVPDEGEGHRGSASQASAIGMNRVFSQGSGGGAAEQNSCGKHAIQIERQYLKIKGEMVKIEKSRLKHQKDMEEQDKELKKMKLCNEKMNLENDKLELEIKLMEMGIKPKRI